MREMAEYRNTGLVSQLGNEAVDIQMYRIERQYLLGISRLFAKHKPRNLVDLKSF